MIQGQNLKYSVETMSRFAMLPLSGSDNEDNTKVDHSVTKPKEIHSNESRNVKINEAPIERGTTDSARGRYRSPRIARGAGRGGLARGGASELIGRGSFAGRGRGRGGNNNRNMDRHSGSFKTGIKPVAKKDGYGTGNWGTVDDELDATNEKPDKTEIETKEDSGNEENTAPTEPPVKTYSEYKALKNKSEKKTDSVETRIKEDQDEVPIHFQCINEIRSDRTNQNKNFEPRGGRGGGRGRGARGGRGAFGESRGSTGPKIPVPSIADVHDFPALA